MNVNTDNCKRVVITLGEHKARLGIVHKSVTLGEHRAKASKKQERK